MNADAMDGHDAEAAADIDATVERFERFHGRMRQRALLLIMLRGLPFGLLAAAAGGFGLMCLEAFDWRATGGVAAALLIVVTAIACRVQRRRFQRFVQAVDRRLDAAGRIVVASEFVESRRSLSAFERLAVADAIRWIEAQPRRGLPWSFGALLSTTHVAGLLLAGFALAGCESPDRAEPSPRQTRLEVTQPEPHEATAKTPPRSEEPSSAGSNEKADGGGFGDGASGERAASHGDGAQSDGQGAGDASGDSEGAPNGAGGGQQAANSEQTTDSGVQSSSATGGASPGSQQPGNSGNSTNSVNPGDAGGAQGNGQPSNASDESTPNADGNAADASQAGGADDAGQPDDTGDGDADGLSSGDPSGTGSEPGETQDTPDSESETKSEGTSPTDKGNGPQQIGDQQQPAGEGMTVGPGIAIGIKRETDDNTVDGIPEAGLENGMKSADETQVDAPNKDIQAKSASDAEGDSTQSVTEGEGVDFAPGTPQPASAPAAAEVDQTDVRPDELLMERVSPDRRERLKRYFDKLQSEQRRRTPPATSQPTSSPASRPAKEPAAP